MGKTTIERPVNFLPPGAHSRRVITGGESAMETVGDIGRDFEYKLKQWYFDDDTQAAQKTTVCSGGTISCPCVSIA